MSNRRNFLKNTAMVTAAAALSPWMEVAAKEMISKDKKIRLKPNSVVLFQGDSITDAGRNKTITEPNNIAGLGNGYASLVAAQLQYDNAARKLKIYNRGVSGNKVFELAARWDKDCLEIKPDVLSILIGVNDFWHTLVHDYKGTLQTYTDDYIKLLTRTKKQLPDLQLIIAEPYSIIGTKVNDKWYPFFYEYQHAARKIANEFGATFIPLQQIFNRAQKALPGNYWAPDGVHPSFAGAQIMASAWLEVFKE